MTETQSATAPPTLQDIDWRKRLRIIVQTMREMSRQTDPMTMGRVYGERIRELQPSDRFIALSRRDMQAPTYRITRATIWTEVIDPWKERDRLPIFSGGLFAELLYGDEPVILDDIEVAADDPAAKYFDGMGSLMAIPHYDRGAGLNMVVLMRKGRAAFNRDDFPEFVWMSNLYGRATHNLVLAAQIKTAYQALDREMKAVADIQRSLLPATLPAIPGMGLAAHYQTSQRAGGDYYDFFPLPGGQWGVLIADVSGHGTPAAVIMAVTHTIAHTYPGEPCPPGKLLAHVNRVLAERYTGETGTFVTAFYAIYDPSTRRLTYASAGHNPPRLKRCADGTLAPLDGVQRLPLGILATEEYPEKSWQLQSGDQIVFYTDGITESSSPTGEQFGTDRLDHVLTNCSVQASDLLKAVLEAVAEFTAGAPPVDDRTVLVAKIV